MEAGEESYHTILGVSSESSIEDINRAYLKLAMFVTVLSDKEKRTLYDAGLYDPDDDEEDEGFSDFVQEMMPPMAQEKKEDKYYSMEELQAMLLEMAQGFEPSLQYCEPWFLDNTRHSKRMQCDSNSIIDSSSSHFNLLEWSACGESSYCS